MFVYPKYFLWHHLPSVYIQVTLFICYFRDFSTFFYYEEKLFFFAARFYCFINLSVQTCSSELSNSWANLSNPAPSPGLTICEPWLGATVYPHRKDCSVEETPQGWENFLGQCCHLQATAGIAAWWRLKITPASLRQEKYTKFKYVFFFYCFHFQRALCCVEKNTAAPCRTEVFHLIHFTAKPCQMHISIHSDP